MFVDYLTEEEAMKCLTVKMADIERSKFSHNDGIIKGYGQWIILKNLKESIFNSPAHWRVEIELTGKGKNSRFGRVLKVVKELNEEEKTAKRIEELLSPLFNTFQENFRKLSGVKIFSDSKEEIGIFATDSSNALLNEALIHKASWWTPDKIYRYSSLADNQLRLDYKLAKKILELQATVWQEREAFFDKVVAIWEREQRRHSDSREIRGRSYSDWLGRFIAKPEKLWTRIPLFVPLKRSHHFSEDQSKTFSWTEEGVRDYEKALEKFVSEAIENIVTEADEFISRQVNRLKKGDWILGMHTVYSYWTAYHDGFGSRSEDDVASSGATQHQKRGLMRVSAVGSEVGLSNKNLFVRLTEKEYKNVANLVDASIHDMKLRLEWLLAKEERRREIYNEHLKVDFLEGQSDEVRFREILRRMEEGWKVWVRDRETGEVKEFKESLAPYDKRQDLAIVRNPEREEYRHRVYGTYGRSSMMTSTRLVAKKFFLYISWEEYQKLPDVREMKKLVAEAETLVRKIWKNQIPYKGKYADFCKEVRRMRLNSSFPSFGKHYGRDCIRGYVGQMRSLLEDFQDLQEIEEFLRQEEEKDRKNCMVLKKENRCPHPPRKKTVEKSNRKKSVASVGDSGGFNNPFAAALAGLKK